MPADILPEVIESLGRARGCEVYRARLTSGGPPVIVKVAETGAGRQVSASLRREFEITRALAAIPGLRVATECRETPGGPMLVYPDDGLHELASVATFPLPAPLLVPVAERLAAALDGVHAAGIVHGGVNPAAIVGSADLAEVRLADFSMAERGATRAGVVHDAAVLAYLAPEQSGRMDRAVDRRADLYGLGVTLYQLATGVQPFENGDPAVILHRHMTLVPDAPIRLNREVPPHLSQAILRLLAKNPEDRFQSAAEVVEAIRAGAAAPLTIPGRLYGRAALIRDLEQEITSGLVGTSRLIRIAGPSGSGKSALVAELVRPAIRAGASFAQGKFDQLDRARPYAAFTQAFDMLLRRLLAESPDYVALWRQRLLDALSPNGQVLLDLLPNYERLIGPQPKLPQLGLNEAQIRVQLVFRRFVGVLARSDCPLILFLDDLQWADSASVDLIELLLADEGIRNLTIIVAYRANELEPSHPTAVLLSGLDARRHQMQRVELAPLAVGDVIDLVVESLDITPEAARPLARVVAEKTGGNPFFIRQYLMSMARKGHLLREAQTGRWTWDIDAASADKFAPDLAELVAERIVALPEDTLQMVRIASCSGNVFDTDVLALTLDIPPEEVMARMAPALREEIVLPLDRDLSAPHRFRFQHDRVQQSAYGSLSEASRARLHARIGEILLLKSADPQSRRIEIADHLIAGREHLSEPTLLRLRALVLEAAQETMQANAYDASLRYLAAAEGTFRGDLWAQEPELAFRMALQRASIAYLKNEIDTARRTTTELLARPLAVSDRVQVLELVILIETSQLNYRTALQTGRDAIALLGEKLVANPSTVQVLVDLMATRRRVNRIAPDALLQLPRMTDPAKQAVMRVLVLLSAPAYFSEPNLLPMIALKMVRLSLAHGNAPDSAFGYVIYGMLHCAVLGDPKRGLAYGLLACRAASVLGAQTIEGRVLMVYAGFIQHWSAPLTATLPIFLDAADRSISAGDLEYHGYTRYGHASYALMAGQPLGLVSDFLEQHLAAVTHSRHEKTRRIITMARASVGRMRGLADDPFAQAFDDAENFRLWTDQADATSLAYFHKYKMLEAQMAGDSAAVLRHAGGMQRNLAGILSMAYQPFYQFYEALALVELSARRGPLRRRSMLLRARHLTRRLERWARTAPRTLSHRVLLLRAELAAAEGQPARAIGLFDEAIHQARQAAALHDIGLFHERAGLFYLRQGARRQGMESLSAALLAHSDWGGDGWRAALILRHPALAASRSGAGSGSAQVPATTSVDSGTLIRAAAAIAQSNSLEEMVIQVLQAVVQNAGADYGALLLEEGDGLVVLADTDAEGAAHVRADRPAAEAVAGLPMSILAHVRSSRERVILEDAISDQIYGRDPQVQALGAASVLCVPLVAGATLVGLVYLRNARLRSAFTADRCDTVEVLGAQAAVSIQNSRLLDRLRAALERQVDLTSAHARFVPENFLEMLKRPSIIDVRLGDHLRGEASILFSDIRGFTPLIERLTPTEAITFINEFLSLMDPAVQANGGFVDSYIGDAVMAVFDRGPTAAIDAALAMSRALADWSVTSRTPDRQPVRIGIGIATGQLIFGTIGAANRLKCSVIGDTVNLASRVEGLTKHYGTGLLVTEETLAGVGEPGRYQTREIDLVTVIGRRTPVRLFEIFDADPTELRARKAATAPDLARGHLLYRDGRIAEARQAFEAARAQYPDDLVSSRLILRCHREEAQGHGPEWTGVEHLAEK